MPKLFCNTINVNPRNGNMLKLAGCGLSAFDWRTARPDMPNRPVPAQYRNWPDRRPLRAGECAGV